MHWERRFPSASCLSRARRSSFLVSRLRSRRLSGAMAAASSAGAHCWLCGAQSFHGDRHDEAAECAASRRGFGQANYVEYVRFKCCGCKCSIECLDAISELKARRMPAGAKVHDPCGIQLLFDVRPWTLASDDPALEEVKEWWTPANPSTRQPAEMRTGPCPSYTQSQIEDCSVRNGFGIAVSVIQGPCGMAVSVPGRPSTLLGTAVPVPNQSLNAHRDPSPSPSTLIGTHVPVPTQSRPSPDQSRPCRRLPKTAKDPVGECELIHVRVNREGQALFSPIFLA